MPGRFVICYGCRGSGIDGQPGSRSAGMVIRDSTVGGMSSKAPLAGGNLQSWQGKTRKVASAERWALQRRAYEMGAEGTAWGVVADFLSMPTATSARRAAAEHAERCGLPKIDRSRRKATA